MVGRKGGCMWWDEGSTGMRLGSTRGGKRGQGWSSRVSTKLVLRLRLWTWTLICESPKVMAMADDLLPSDT